MDYEAEIVRLKALTMIQSADVSSLLGLVGSTLEGSVRTRAEADARFLSERKKLLHVMLERLEKTQPAVAGSILQEIERSSTNHPLGYEGD